MAALDAEFLPDPQAKIAIANDIIRQKRIINFIQMKHP